MFDEIDANSNENQKDMSSKNIVGKAILKEISKRNKQEK